MKYYITYKIEARYVAEVEADNLEQAMKKQNQNILMLISEKQKILMAK